MAKDFSHLLIKEYTHWSIYIHENQGYLGRCIIWCKRADAEDLSEATDEERDELFNVIKELKDAVTKAFKSDWFNYSFLGNETRHLHCHFIPRYKNAREFMGIRFDDKLWGSNYKTDKAFKISDDVLVAIQSKIKECIT